MDSFSKTSDHIRVVIIDDHPLVRDGLRSRIDREADMSTCGEAEDVISALRQIEQQRPDVAIVDLSLKTGNGLDLISRLVAAGSSVRVIVSSMHDEHIYGERVVKAGALGYVNKQEASTKIVDAIRQVMNGRLFVSDELNSRLMQRVINGQESEADPVRLLTDRELQVFESIGEGRTVKETADAMSLSPKTIETYRDRIRSKLNVDSATRLTHYAVRWVAEHNES